MNAAAKNRSVMVCGIPSGMIMKVWPGVESVLARVVKPDTGYTLQSVLTALQLKDMQLWVIGDFQGVVVTKVENRPSQRVLFTLFLAGDNMSEWINDWCDVQEGYARQKECVAIEFNGRKGWNKIRENRPEWKAVRTVFRQELC